MACKAKKATPWLVNRPVSVGIQPAEAAHETEAAWQRRYIHCLGGVWNPQEIQGSPDHYVTGPTLLLPYPPVS